MTSKEVDEVTADPLVLDPEFEELLREVASDPESTLLRIPRPKVVRGFFERDEAVSANATMLTRAERHLVQVHRSELAWLLRQVCIYKLVEGPESRLYVSHHGPTGEDCSPLQPPDWMDRIQYQQGIAAEDEQQAVGIQLIHRCVRQPLGHDPKVAELAAVAHRLLPTNHSRLLSAIDLCRGDAPWTGLQLSSQILSMHPTSEHATRAWECAGFVFARLGRLNDAHLAYSRGSTSEDQHTLMNRLEFAFQVGDRQDAIDTARRLNDLLPGDSMPVAWFIESRHERRMRGEWAPTPPGRELAKSLADKMDGVSRRIAYGLL
jgi:hypothetical protein